MQEVITYCTAPKPAKKRNVITCKPGEVEKVIAEAQRKRKEAIDRYYQSVVNDEP